MQIAGPLSGSVLARSNRNGGPLKEKKIFPNRRFYVTFQVLGLKKKQTGPRIRDFKEIFNFAALNKKLLNRKLRNI